MSEETKLVRWGEVVAMARREGITVHVLKAMKKAEVFKPIHLTPNSKAFYSRDEVKEKVLNAGNTQRV